MSKEEKLNNDPRIGEILNLILQIAGGNLEARAVPSEQGDELDAIISGLNMLVEEIKSKIEFELQAKARSEAAISEMIDVIMEVARGNYSVQVGLSDKNDEFDSLAMGINMMIDDIRNVITEREQAEEALLLKSEIITNMTEGVYLIRAEDGIIVYTNPAFERMFGYGPNELVGKHVSTVNAPSVKDPEEVASEIIEIIDKTGKWQGEICNIKKDGTTFWCYAHVTGFDHPEYGSSWVSVHTDITERKQAEEALRNRENQISLLLNSTAEAIYGLDLDGNCTFANSACVNLLGYKQLDDILGKNMHDLMHHTHPNGTTYPVKECKIYQAFRQGKGAHVDDEVLWRADGTSFPAEYWSYPIIQDGEVIGSVVTFLDITQRRQLEDEREEFAYDLNERMKEFRCLYSIANSIRSERSFEELLVDTTKYVKDAWQYPEVTRSKIRFNGKEYKGIEFQETRYKQAADIVVRGETRGAIEVYYLNEMPKLDEGPFLKDERKLLDEIASYLGTYAGKIEMEEERRMMESRLNQAQRLKAVGQLSTGIAHEINTPLQYLGDNLRFLEDANNKMAGLLKSQGLAIPTPEEDRSSPGAIETAEDRLGINDVDYLIEEVPSAIRQSLEGVEYISKIVQAMKNFAQPGVEGTTAIDINEAIESTVEVSRNEWKSAADVELNLDPNIPQIQCVPSEINQAILAVLLNAAQAIEDSISDQATDEKGTISISTHREGDEVEIRIEDTGTGIPEDIQPHVFEPFFTTRDVGQGSGQGLTIAYSIIVEGHDGSITFKTEEGKGTTFFIRLPILP